MGKEKEKEKGAPGYCGGSAAERSAG